MSHQILIKGRYLSPERAAREARPLDIELVCSNPECGSTHIVASEPRNSTRIGKEFEDCIPRQQDRRCLACGHRWTAILPPLSYAVHTFQR